MFHVQPLTRPSIIHDVLTDQWIAARIRHDAREPGYIEHPALSYYGAYAYFELAGVFLAIRHSPWEIEVHAALLKNATPHGRRLGQIFLQELWRDSDLERVTAPVLATLPSAINYTRRLGFEHEGTRRNAVKVGGVLTDVVYMGLLRPSRV